MKENRFYRQFFHNAPFACAHHEMLCDDEGNPFDYRFIEANEAFTRLTGLDRESLVGCTVRQAFPGAQSTTSGWRNLYDRIIAGKGSAEFNHSIGHPGKWVMVQAWHTDAAHVAIALTDITPGRQSPGPDFLMEMQQQVFWDNDLFGVMIADKNGKYIDANEQACRMTGYSCEELKSMTLFQLIRPEQMEEARSHFEQIGETGKAYGETPYYTKSGEKRWWNVVGARLSGDCFLGLHEDITERKRADEALQESEERFRSILNNVSTVAVQGYAMDGTVKYWNKASEDFYGYTAGEALDQNLCDLIVPPFMSNDVKKAIQHMTRTGEVIPSSELELMRKDGTLIPVYSSHVLVRVPGKELELYCIDVDLTKRKRAEAELFKLNADLEVRVTERTAQLLEANRELEAFCYSVSHDLRSPLRAINGYAGILMADYHARLDDEGKHVCSALRENTLMMGTLIDDLLSFSRYSRAEIRKSAIDMKELFLSVYNEIADEKTRKSIDLKIGDMCSIHGDPLLIRQVLVNLLSNAIKFSSGRARPEITVGFQRKNNRMAFCIQDNGAGFDMKYADKMFGVFQRLHSTKEFEGTGVGLAIVRRIIERHGGEVWAEGEVDKGASFYFSLPEVP